MNAQPPAVRVPTVAEATVFIVGGTSGVGLRIARCFVRAGTQRIGLVGRNIERGEQATKSIYALASGVWALLAAGDVNDPAEAERVTTELSNSLGTADILINCTTRSFTAQANMCRAVLPDMRAQHGGVIVNVASAANGAATAAIVRFSENLERETEGDGIRINAVTPSPIGDTEPADVAELVLSLCSPQARHDPNI